MNRSAQRRVALKVDCDTFVGTRDGVPRLLEVFAARGIRATFFFSYGPDRSGVAVRRVFTKRGFLKKMLRSRAASLYGFPTILYGTFLASPMIGERCARQIREAARAGHETGVHGWDHVGWHDHLDRWTEEKIREEYGRAHEEHRRILASPARASAAPGWTANARSLAVEEEHSLLYTSNTRGGSPFFPSAGARLFRTLEIPSTLPTLDETLTWRELPTEEQQQSFFRSALRETEVHTIHADVEGRLKLPLFTRILDGWIAGGATFVALEELAKEALARREDVPTRPLTRTTLTGRAGTVATGWPEQTESGGKRLPGE
jgi:peptidoglycan/xylan/chitin deacetylase (PgdA/CDA1 family)